VTLLYGVYHCAERRFEYARAGHELPLLIDPDGEWIEVTRSPGQPLGLFEDLLLDVQQLSLPVESLLVLYTDGVTESFDPDHVQFGHENTYRSVRAVRNLPAEEICDHLLEALRTHRGGNRTADDVTVMAIKVKTDAA